MHSCTVAEGDEVSNKFWKFRICVGTFQLFYKTDDLVIGKVFVRF